MRSWVVRRLDGIDALELVDAPEPDPPGEGEVTVAMQAVAINFPDLLMLSGGYQYRPELPFTPGMEGVGHIIAVGEGVAGDLIGHRMLLGGRTGLLAERVTCALATLREAPEALTNAEAAGFTVGALTAHVALAERGRLHAGEHLLVLGASGGTGLAAVGMGKLLGARVTAVTSSADKRNVLRQAGADEVLVVERASPDFPGLKGAVDVVFDPVGGIAAIPAMKTLRRGGRYLVIGFAGGMPPPVPTNIALLKEIEIVGVRAGEAGRRDPVAAAAHMAAIEALAARGLLKPVIALEVPMEDATEAFRAMERGSLAGKAIVRIGAGA